MTGVVILNYNRVEDTLRCIESVRKFCPDIRLCVVDNASSPEVTSAVGAALLPSEKYIINSENLGYARGNNVALRYFDAVPEVDKILILNNDVILTEDIVTPLAAYLDAHEDCGVVSPLLKTRDGGTDFSCARSFKSVRDLTVKATSLGRLGFRTREFILKEKPSLLNAHEVQTDLPSGSCMMLPKSLFSRIGFFDPATFLYFEEDILGTRLSRLGYRSVLLTGVSAIHLGAGTTSSMSSRFIYGCYRDSLLYYLKNYTDCPESLSKYISLRTKLASIVRK